MLYNPRLSSNQQQNTPSSHGTRQPAATKQSQAIVTANLNTTLLLGNSTVNATATVLTTNAAIATQVDLNKTNDSQYG